MSGEVSKDVTSEPLKGEVLPPKHGSVWVATFRNSHCAEARFEWRKLGRNYRKAVLAELMGGKRSYFTFSETEDGVTRTVTDMHLVSLGLE